MAICPKCSSEKCVKDGIIPNNSLLYLETQNTVVGRLLGMILNNFIVNPLKIISLGSKGHFFKKILAYELRFCR